MLRSILRWFLAALTLGLLVLPSPSAAAENGLSARRAGASLGASRLGPPPALQAVLEPGPELEGEEWSRRAWLLELSGGGALGLCPDYSAACSALGGWSLSGLVQSRPVAHFSWGPFYNQSAHLMSFSAENWSLRQHTRSFALGLAGRLWMSDQGRYDPYVQVAAGLGHVSRTATFQDAGLSANGVAARRSDGESADAVPLYAISTGLAVQVTPVVRIGGELGWSHWLIEKWERCPVLSGLCVTPPGRAYDPRNGVLSLGISLGVSFGSRL